MDTGHLLWVKDEEQDLRALTLSGFGWGRKRVRRPHDSPQSPSWGQTGTAELGGHRATTPGAQPCYLPSLFTPLPPKHSPASTCISYHPIGVVDPICTGSRNHTTHRFCELLALFSQIAAQSIYSIKSLQMPVRVGEVAPTAGWVSSCCHFAICHWISPKIKKRGTHPAPLL